MPTDIARKEMDMEEEIPAGWQFIQSMIAKGERKGEKKGRVEGRAEGKAEGRVEGKAEGKTEALRNSILTFLQTRFGLVQKRTESLINRQTDISILYFMVREAALCSSLKDFVDAVKSNHTS